jgi:hypothetical protein
MDDTVIGHCGSVQTLQVHLIIIRMKEDRLAIVPALDDVLRHVDQRIARGSRHRRPQNEGLQRYIRLLTFGLYQVLQNPSLTPLSPTAFLYRPFHRHQQHQRLYGSSAPVPDRMEDQVIEWAM